MKRKKMMNGKKKIHRFLAAAVFLAVLAGCSSTSRISLMNLSILYQKEAYFTHLPVAVYHSGDSTSLAIVGIQLDELRYVNIPNTGLKYCYYRLSYRLMDNYEARTVLDSGSVVSGDTINAGRQIMVLQSIQFRAKRPQTYILEIVLTDLNRNEKIKNFIQIDKSSMATRQNFLALSEDNQPLFRDFIGSGEKVSLMCNNPLVNQLQVRCYFRDFPLARPPFSEDKQDVFDYRADSIFTIPVYQGKTGLFLLEREGFYHFQSDTTGKQGITLFRFYDGYPEIKSTAQLVTPLRYITTKTEYDKILEAEDQKDAVDQFWLETAGNAPRAKTLIQKYYTNVEESNDYFTSYQEGWKTDRGLIYIIFGRPDIVYRGNNTEEWTYGEPDQRNSLRFDFIKVNNPFTDNDYMLLRSASMKDPWYITVQSWRR
jgi:GWxTD domain-containing protein